jgi:Bromodomain
MAAPILNDVNAHKLAGIFAKPLTERDAPGYKDLIYRPQDLKSIRAAVGRGSRAANAVIDELEATKADDEEAGSPATVVKATNTTTPSGSILVKKTEDLRPPKGIVNSAQLEMEFMRLFANAVMFNPLPPSERGLPAELKLERDGSNSSRQQQQQQRSQRAKAESKDRGWDGDDGGAGDDGDGEKKGYAQEEEGGIIHDTREIFASVEKSVQQWRSVEQGYIDDVPRNGAGAGLGLALGLRGGSVSMSDAVAEESAQEEGELVAGVLGSGIGTARKRRRLME